MEAWAQWWTCTWRQEDTFGRHLESKIGPGLVIWRVRKTDVNLGTPVTLEGQHQVGSYSSEGDINMKDTGVCGVLKPM